MTTANRKDFKLWLDHLFEMLPVSLMNKKRIMMMLVIKNMPANAGGIRDGGSISGLGRSPGGGHGNPL